MPEPTREVFGNIAPWMQGLFYAVITASLLSSALHVASRCRLWRKGVPGEIERDPRVWLRRLPVYALGQKRVLRRSLGGVLHLLLFAGFSMLALGTTLLFLADRGPAHFHHGAYYLGYETTMDLFGVSLVAGCLLGLYRRAAARPNSLGHARADYALLGLLLSIGVTGFLLEALRLQWDGTRPEVARCSFVGYALASTAFGALDVPGARTAHLALWWVHVGLIAAFFAAFARTRFLHVLTGTANILLRPSRPAGKLVTAPMAAVEETGRIGVSSPEHLTQQQLLSLDACMECGRCEDACPAHASGKPLSPKSVIGDLRRAADRRFAISNSQSSVSSAVIEDETLWSCTMCQACVFECPVLIGHVDLIVDMRRNLVGEGRLSGPPAQSLRRLGSQGNPYGRPASDRLEWAEGLDVPTLADLPDAEVLLWIGCAASYDPRARKIARATAQLLQHAGVRFAVLGKQERCTGDPARRLGDEFLFQQMAEENAGRLSGAPGKIVTPCPHCMNTLRHEYPDFGARFEVVHHTQFLADLVSSGRLSLPESGHTGAVTLHDPCYLARVNGETQPVRELLHAAGAELREMSRHGEKTFCCGAGGGRFWFEERPEQRVNRLRAAEALRTGTETVVTACPFCLNMMTDGLAGSAGGELVRVRDISEVLLDRFAEPPVRAG